MNSGANLCWHQSPSWGAVREVCPGLIHAVCPHASPLKLIDRFDSPKTKEPARAVQTHLNIEVGTPRRGVRGRPGGRTEWDAPLADAGPSLPVNSKISTLIFNGLYWFRCVCPACGISFF